MKDAKGNELKEGDIALVPVIVGGIHSHHCAAVSLFDRADGGKDTFYVATGVLFRANQDDKLKLGELTKGWPNAAPKDDPKA